MSAEREPIGVIGTGYVGLVTAAGFAALGSEVWCVDIDAAKVERLRRGEVPIYEPGLEQLLAEHSERLHFSTDLGQALDLPTSASRNRDHEHRLSQGARRRLQRQRHRPAQYLRPR